VDALVNAKRELAKAENKFKMLGAGEALGVIRDALTAVDVAVGVQAEVTLLMFEQMMRAKINPKLHEGVLQTIGMTNANTQMIVQRIMHLQHGEKCTCHLCMPSVRVER
jgi:hypothetical protein